MVYNMHMAFWSVVVSVKFVTALSICVNVDDECVSYFRSEFRSL